MVARNEDTSDREIVHTRLYDAPRELVFDVWTDVNHLSQWWGPNGFTTTTREFSVRPGGVWRFTMHGPDGRDYKNLVTFIEVVRPERLVYKHRGEDEHEDVSFQTIVTFADEGGKTRLTMRGIFPSAEERDRVAREYGAVEGGRQTLERLADYLQSVRPAADSRTRN